MISGYLVGDKELVARMTALAPAVKADMDATVNRLGLQLEANVAHDYLTGQVLKVRTDRLRRSISRSDGGDTRSRFESTPLTSFSYVGTNVSYGTMWELYGMPAYDIVPVKAKALRFEIGGEVFFRKRVHHPAQAARPFLAPALAAFKPFAIEQMKASLQRTAEQVMK